MDPFEGIVGREGERLRQQLVQRDAERIEIAAGIDRSVHAAGLLGRHVGERAGDDLRRSGILALARQARRDPESGQPHAAGRVEEHVRRLDVLVNEAALVDLAERASQGNRGAQDRRQITGSTEHAIDRLAARILEHEHHALLVPDERQRPHRPCGIELGREGIFVLEAFEGRRRRRRRDGREHEDLRGGRRRDLRRVSRLAAAVQDELAAVAQRLQHVSGKVCHVARPCQRRSVNWVPQWRGSPGRPLKAGSVTFVAVPVMYSRWPTLRT